MSRTRIAPAAETPSRGKPSGKLRRGTGNRTPNTADKAAEVARKLRRERVGQLTIQGMSQRAIAAELGIDQSTVSTDLAAYLAQPSPTREEVRAVCDQRLERSLERLDVQARVAQRMIFATKKDKDGRDVPANDAATILAAQALLVRIDDKLRMNNESRRRLHGADAPEVKEHTGLNGGPIPVATTGASLAELLEIVEHNRKPPS